MSLINVREKTLQAKIVYYGTALSGKTTSLKHVHRVLDPDGRVELVSLNTEGDRTFFFDFLPIPLGSVNGYQVRLQAFTVPGQVKYNLTRRFVLRGADAVIFVADSGSGALEDDRTSMQSLHENLRANGLSADKLPILLQYNKRDLPDALPVEKLREALNFGGLREFESVATSGDGVFEAFTALCSATVESLAREYRLGNPEEAREAVAKRLAATHVAWRSGRGRRGPAQADTANDTLIDLGVSPAASPVVEVSSLDVPDIPNAETLLRHAVDTNIESAKLLAEMSEMRRRLADHVRHLAALYETGVAIASVLDVDQLLDRVLSAALRTVEGEYGSVLLLGEGGALGAKLVHGLESDPLAEQGNDPEILERILAKRPFVVDVETVDAALAASSIDDPCAMVALVAPLVHQNEVLGALSAYVLDRPLDTDLRMRLKFLGAVASQASVALVNARLYARVESFNRELEKTVAERTVDLQKALAELRVVDRMKDDFLASMSHELLTPLQSIGSSAEILAAMAGDEGAKAAEERAEFAGVVQRESCRLTGILRSVLDLREIDSGALACAPVPVTLRDAAVECYERHRAAFKGRHVRFRVRLEEGLPAASADPRHLGRVLDAVVSNALKFCPEGSDVLIALRRDGENARIEVRDEGPGVPEALRATIFERFKQGGDVLTEKPPGLGLGLPIARLLAERMEGSIAYEPGNPSGSVFVVTIPLASAPVAA
jgi:signal transduction histidine kinase/signal recognition particle receptor subunit beta